MQKSNVVRQRSISRERIVVIDPGDRDSECLDPAQLLRDLLPKLTTLDIPLVVTLTDNSTSVSYPLNVFTSKLWRINDGKVIFGLKKIRLSELSANITYDIDVETAKPQNGQENSSNKGDGRAI
jgi:hypothetical protein